MRQQVPAYTKVTCDFCGAAKGDTNFKTDAQVVLKQDALDHLGCAVASGDFKADACDKCAGEINAFLQAKQKQKGPNP